MTQGATVLFVDDEEDLRSLCSLVLTRAGYRVLVARDGKEGLALFQEHAAEVRLVVTDVNMPGGDGWLLYRRLRELRADINLLFVSGFSAEGRTPAQCRALDSGEETLEKPFTMNRLVAKVKEMLER